MKEPFWVPFAKGFGLNQLLAVLALVRMAPDLGTHVGTADSDETASEGPWEMLDLSPASSAGDDDKKGLDPMVQDEFPAALPEKPEAKPLAAKVKSLSIHCVPGVLHSWLTKLVRRTCVKRKCVQGDKLPSGRSHLRRLNAQYFPSEPCHCD